MKKIVGIVSLLTIVLTLAGCSTDKKADTIESSKSTSTSSLAKKEKKAGEKKEEAEKKEAEKKKQEEISKKVTEADVAMKAAEANPTDETIAAAKTTIDAIPGGNAELLKRLETATQNLESIKQQAAAQQAAEQAQQTEQQAPVTPAEQPQITADQQAEIDRQPTFETDENGRTYIFENHNAYKDEPYYTEDWKKYPSPYQDQ